MTTSNPLRKLTQNIRNATNSKGTETTPETPRNVTGVNAWTQWRPGQQEAARAIVDWLKSDRPVMALTAPAGAGKTLLAAVACHDYEVRPARSVILTPRRSLQAQMADSLGHTYPTLYGRANYRCVSVQHAGKSGTAADADCAVPPAPAGGISDNARLQKPKDCDAYRECPYHNALNAAARSPHPITNYAVWQSSRESTAFETIRLTVCDEAHLLPDTITAHMQKELPAELISLATKRNCPPPPNPKRRNGLSTRMNDWKAWSRKVMNEVPAERSPNAPASRLNAVAKAIDAMPTNQWAIAGQPEQEATFAPVAPALEDLVPDFRKGHCKILLLSATVSPELLKHLGLTPRDYTTYEMPSTWATERSPVSQHPRALDMSHKAAQANPELPLKAKKLWLEILAQRDGNKALFLASAHRDVHDRDKGVISGLKQDGQAVAGNRDSSELPAALTQHKNSVDGVLASASIGIGYDFPHEQARMTVIPRIPYPNLGDELVRARVERWGWSWADWQAIAAAQQMAGRGMRAADDWVWTVCADSRWNAFLQRTKNMQAKWFRDRIAPYRDYAEFQPEMLALSPPPESPEPPPASPTADTTPRDTTETGGETPELPAEPGTNQADATDDGNSVTERIRANTDEMPPGRDIISLRPGIMTADELTELRDRLNSAGLKDWLIRNQPEQVVIVATDQTVIMRLTRHEWPEPGASVWLAWPQDWPAPGPTGSNPAAAAINAAAELYRPKDRTPESATARQPVNRHTPQNVQDNRHQIPGTILSGREIAELLLGLNLTNREHWKVDNDCGVTRITGLSGVPRISLLRNDAAGDDRYTAIEPYTGRPDPSHTEIVKQALHAATQADQAKQPPAEHAIRTHDAAAPDRGETGAKKTPARVSPRPNPAATTPVRPTIRATQPAAPAPPHPATVDTRQQQADQSRSTSGLRFRTNRSRTASRRPPPNPARRWRKSWRTSGTQPRPGLQSHRLRPG